MTDPARAVLRRAAAHVLVADIEAPVLDDATAHHVFRVLRLRDGDTLTVTDGCGRWRLCRAAGRDVEAVAEPNVVERGAPLTIGFAIPKSDRPEWIVQKLTELGIARIVLLHAERSVVRWDPERADRHLAKLHRVAVEALQQSRGVWLSELSGPLAAADFLPGASVAEPEGRPLRDDDHTVAIGPEGGWSDEELALAGDQIALGGTVLRVETAAVVAGALMASQRA